MELPNVRGLSLRAGRNRQPVRLAAVGDLHVVPEARGSVRAAYENLAADADLLLLAGDLTNSGRVEEVAVLQEEFVDLGVPVVAVLGNHDYKAGNAEWIAKMLCDIGVHVLNGQSIVFDIHEIRVGVAGVPGHHGGFDGFRPDGVGDLDTDEVRAGLSDVEGAANNLRAALLSVECDLRVALTHYSPVVDTLAGEPLEIYPYLGNALLAEAIDAGSADLAIHGHAHFGTETGKTPGGTPVRNVARSVINRPYAVYNG